MGIVKTWGNKNEVIDYLSFNGYFGVRHLFGKFYFCSHHGIDLMDVKRIIG